MIIDKILLDELTEQAKASPRLRVAYDLRTNPEDGSQRMLNAMEPGTVLPIHRHQKTAETIICLRGHLRLLFYDELERMVTDVYDLTPNGPCYGLNIPAGQWHSVEVIELGTVIIEMKNGAYEPLAEVDILAV